LHHWRRKSGSGNRSELGGSTGVVGDVGVGLDDGVTVWVTVLAGGVLVLVTVRGGGMAPFTVTVTGLWGCELGVSEGIEPTS
jgi:hypothetical protein